MTNEAYRAKEWLNRNYNFASQVDADRRMLMIMESRLTSAVAKYQSDGTESRDTDQARSRHEDALLDYSMQKKKVEAEERKLLSEMTKTRRAIDELSLPEHQAVAIDRYINRLSWNDIAKEEHVSRSQHFRVHSDMLEKMAEILRGGRYDT